MVEPLVLHHGQQDNSSVADSLQKVLAATYGLFLATHNYHWNVEGNNFVSLHALFEEQYNGLFKAIDLIAERIRALGAYALPFEGEDIVQLTKMTSNALNKEVDADLRANRMVLNLIDLTNSVVAICESAKLEALDNEDEESESLMIERITAHQKALWMLRSVSK